MALWWSPNGSPLPLMTTELTGADLQGLAFGIAVDANGHVWIRERRDQREPVASNTI
jgi:hypothetical protein